MLRSSFRAILFFVASSVFGCPGFAAADDAKPPTSLTKGVQIQDAGEPPKLLNDDSVDVVLKRWKEARSKITRIDAGFSYIRYDTVPSKVQRHGEGQLAFDSSGRGFFKLLPVPLSSEQRAKRTDLNAKDKSGYAVGRPADAMHCYWTGTHFYTSDESLLLSEPAHAIPAEERLGEFYPTRASPPSLPETQPARRPERPQPPAIPMVEPEEPLAALSDLFEAYLRRLVFGGYKGKQVGFVDGINLAAFHHFEPEVARPFIIGMPVEVLQQRYNISLVPNSGSGVRLKFQSKEGQLPYPSAELILSRDSWMPQAVKFIGPCEMAHSVYVFKRLQFDDSNGEPLENFKRPNRKRHRTGSLLSKQSCRWMAKVFSQATNDHGS